MSLSYSKENEYNLIDRRTNLGRVHATARNNGSNSKTKVVGSKVLVVECKNNVVKSAEKSTVKNIRAYYIKKIQEIEARHQKQLSEAKAHLYVSKQEAHSLKREIESRRDGIFSSERRPLVNYVRKSSKNKVGNMKDSFQQTDALPGDCLSFAGPINLPDDKSKFEDLQSQIEKVTTEKLLQEQLVKRLTDQV